MNRLLVLVAILLAVAVLVIWVAGGASKVGDTEGTGSLVFNITMMVMLLSSLVLGWRGSAGLALRQAGIWAAIFFALVLGYSYRHEMNGALQRVGGELNPAKPIERANSEVALRRSDDGHFYVDAGINGSDIRLLADTGATTVALSIEDAQSAGIDVDQLDFNMRVSTANGQAAAAAVTLDEVRVGSIVRHDVRAMVGRGLSGSLLGMSFFNTLSKFQIENDELLLRD